MNLHRRALQVITIALCLDVIFGLIFSFVENIPVWHGLYCALANAVTVGADIPPRHPLGYLVTAGECITVVPLFAAAFSLFTTSLTTTHVDRRLRQHHRELHERLTAAGIPKMPAGPSEQV